MKFFRELDLYKAIIVVSLLVLPVALGWVYMLDTQIAQAKDAIVAAERSNGELEKIGMLQRQLETVEKNATSSRTAGGSHRVFFEQVIQTSSGGTLSANDFEISPENRTGVPGKGNAQDQQVSIQFRREGKELDLPRDFVHALIFNVESTGTQVWKLRELTMRNVELAKSTRGKTAPQKTVDDVWQVQKLTFARREPDTTRKK